MTKHVLGINTIKYGEIHSYYPLKIDSALSFETIIDRIAKSNIIFKEEYQEKILNTLGSVLAKSTDEFNSKHLDDSPIYFKMEDYEKYKSLPSDSIDLSNQEIKIQLDLSGSSLKISIASTELEVLENRIDRIGKELDTSLNVYGKNFIFNHERFLLLPLKIELFSGETVWIFPILYLFSNKMGILKLELPLIDVDSKPLKRNNTFEFISKIHCTWSNSFPKCESLNDISRFYTEALSKETATNIWKYDDILEHIILVDFDGIPAKIESLSDTLQEDIFRILSAPVPERNCTSYKADAREHISNYSWGKHNAKYIVKTTGGCLSLIDLALLEHCKETFKNSIGVRSLDKSDYLQMCNHLARDLQVNAELALFIVILKKITNHNVIIEKLSSPKEVSRIQTDYWENTKFICELQETCYGTVSEQISTFESMMPYYLKPEITATKLAAIDNMLNEKQQQKNSAFQNFTVIFGLMLSLFFGLPSIYDTLGIIRKSFAWISLDVPYVSQLSLSLTLWFLLNVIIIYHLIKNRLK